MKVLVVGGGGREHALVWKIAQSPLVEALYCAPGNPGIARYAECIDIAASDIDGIVRLAEEKQCDLTGVGPEDPLARGLVDRLSERGLRAFGPTQAAAQLEASKAFAKHIMHKHGIPTAAYAEFDTAWEAVDYVKAQGAPIVVKADGLAAGKGVTVARTVEEAIEAIDSAMTSRVFGDAGAKVVIEECLVGEEASILAFSDGKTIVPMVPSQDHKAVFDGDKGPNTGGMGAYSPAPVVSEKLLAEIQKSVLEPCIAGMAHEGAPYVGILYAGLIMTAEGPKVIEFNCRFGDPETQVVLPRMTDDIVPIFLACCDGTLNKQVIAWSTGACVSVVMASGGYPGPFQKGFTISGIEDAERGGALVFHAGTRQTPDGPTSNGGRVLNVTALGSDIPTAIDKAYEAVRRIHFENAHWRTDIGKKALARIGKGS